tara:strand:+ start:2779 stop:3336 length:558 start_codon:yes stop_codon:yes gene_type:complete
MKKPIKDLVLTPHNVSPDIMDMASNRFEIIKGRKPTNQELEDIFYISEMKYIVSKDPGVKKIKRTLNNDDSYDDDNYIPDNSDSEDDYIYINRRRRKGRSNIKAIKKNSNFGKIRSNHHAKTIVPSKKNNKGEIYYPCPHCPKICFHAPACLAHVKSCSHKPPGWNDTEYFKPRYESRYESRYEY